MAGREKSSQALRTIREAAEILGLEQHVLRFWETKFSQIQPMKRRGGRRFYRPEDIEVLKTIKSLLHEQGYTIKGALLMLTPSGQLIAGAVAPVEAATDHQAHLQLVDVAAGEGASIGTAQRESLKDIRSELLDIKDSLKQAI